MMRFDIQLRLQDMMRAESVAATAQLEGVVIVDPRLVEELQEQRGQALFGFARRLGLTDDQAADAVQETLLRLWRDRTAGVPSRMVRHGRSAPSTASPWMSIGYGGGWPGFASGCSATVSTGPAGPSPLIVTTA